MGGPNLAAILTGGTRSEASTRRRHLDIASRLQAGSVPSLHQPKNAICAVPTSVGEWILQAQLFNLVPFWRMPMRAPIQLGMLMIALVFTGCSGKGSSSGGPVPPAQTAPAPPTGLNATAGAGEVVLTWTASSGATSYHVKRAATSGGTYTQVGAPAGVSYTDTGLVDGTTYYYVVSALNSVGESGNSNEASATPAAIVTTTPVPPAAYVIPDRTYDPNAPLTTPVGSGTQYHVALTGADTNDGTSTHPFRTVQHGFDALTNGGDTLLIHGGLYREHVKVVSKDAPAGGFVIGPAGDGEVIVDGSTQVTGWTSQGGNVYMAHTGFDVAAVVVDNQPLYKELSVADLQAAPTVATVPSDYRFYHDSAAQDLYVRVAGGAPGTHDTGVISTDNTKDGIYLWKSNNYAASISKEATTRQWSGARLFSMGITDWWSGPTAAATAQMPSSLGTSCISTSCRTGPEVGSGEAGAEVSVSRAPPQALRMATFPP
jgi:hypothetical protein